MTDYVITVICQNLFYLKNGKHIVAPVLFLYLYVNKKTAPKNGFFFFLTYFVELFSEIP